MTKKDYELIAKAIRDVYLYGIDVDKGTLDDVARSLAAHLATTNPRFDRERFIKACACTKKD